MIFSTDLIQRLQSDYVTSKYKEGVFTFLNIDEKTLKQIVTSFILWAEEKNLVKDNKLDISTMKGQ